MSYFEDRLKNHDFFKDLKDEHIAIIAGCCQNKVFQAGEVIGQEGEPADDFYLVREGKAAIQIFAPKHGEVTLQTIGQDEIIGWSWLFPPYTWNFDVKAIERTRTIALDGKCLREKCDNQPELGYPLMKKFSQNLIQRLRATRMQILDIYQNTPPS